jgi:hypothetical protein
MAETIVLDHSAAILSRTQVEITPWISDAGVDWGDAQIEQYLADGTYGASPVDYRIPNRTITIPLKLQERGTVSFETARRWFQAKAARLQQEGGAITRITATGTLHADVVNASLKLGGGWGQSARSYDADATLTLTCLPDFYGNEITLDDITETTNPELISTLKLSGSNATIKGDYPGRVRIVVDEDDNDNQYGMFWGIRSRNYSSATTAALAYQAEALTPLDAAATTAIAGASGGTVVRHNSLATAWTPVLSTQILSGGAQMTHQGSYRVWARVYSTSATPPDVRLVWDVGDLTNVTENNAWTVPAASQFFIGDLGVVRLAPAPVGTHRWQGIIQALGAAGGENLSVDRIWFQPLDEYAGVLTAPFSSAPGLVSFSARDEFTGMSVGGTLNGRVAPTGGTWSTTGSAGDFLGNAGFTGDGVTDMVARTATGTRFALAGTATYSSVAVSVGKAFTGFASTNAFLGALARYVDSSNYLALKWSANTVRIDAVVSGGTTTLDSVAWPTAFPPFVYLRMDLVASTRGEAKAYLYDGQTGATLGSLSGWHSALASGGAIATGRVGLVDMGSSTGGGPFAQYYDEFLVWRPDLDAVAYAGQSLELRTDGMHREDSTGTAYGPVARVTGDMPRLPVAGIENRPVELLIKSTRGDLDQIPDSGIDDISARATYRPCYLFLPDS